MYHRQRLWLLYEREDVCSLWPEKSWSEYFKSSYWGNERDQHHKFWKKKYHQKLVHSQNICLDLVHNVVSQTPKWLQASIILLTWAVHRYLLWFILKWPLKKKTMLEKHLKPGKSVTVRWKVLFYFILFFIWWTEIKPIKWRWLKMLHCHL